MPLSVTPPSGPVTLSSNARTVLEKRYLVKDKTGKPTETPEALFWRVSTVVADADALVAFRRRHSDIGDHHVGVGRSDEGKQFVVGTGGAYPTPMHWRPVVGVREVTGYRAPSDVPGGRARDIQEFRHVRWRRGTRDGPRCRWAARRSASAVR